MGTDKTKSISERRVHPRHKAKVDVNYRHGETYLFSRTENLSELGIFLVSNDPFDKGTKLDLRFLPPGGEPLEITGEVMWVDRGSRGSPAGMGVRFIDPNKQIRERIRTLIRTIAYLE
ncbi:MAG: hypothetical protein GY854_13525 [Deltaproteobacteria bacterium]|nr:hypothetical protein [Deltaproteobacteria bacterium]